MKVVAVSGYFDPIHVGHLEYLKMSKKLGDKLVVIVNNNHQCVLKKGKPFMDEKDRLEIVKSLKMVDEVFLSIDKDKSVCASLEAIKPNILLMVEIGLLVRYLSLRFVKNTIYK